MNSGVIAKLRIAVVAVLLIMAAAVAYEIVVFFWNHDLIARGLVTVIDFFIWILKNALLFTLPCLIAPIVIYLLLHVIVRNPILRLVSGIGCTYLFWIFGGDVEFSLSGAWALVRLLFQVYFLIILVMPQELMMAVGAIACMIGTIIIDFLPDVPLTTVDDLAAICALISMVFLYINTLATLIKQKVAPLASACVYGEKISLSSVFTRKKKTEPVITTDHVSDPPAKKTDDGMRSPEDMPRQKAEIDI